ncbi:MAG: glycosyltransferase [Deltaproteobacteria bacterium]|nr:glycosyltransferase [Deltaproteobacteria bacterium]
MKRSKVSVVIPVYNEEDNLESLFERLMPVMSSLGREYEVILVDDGSTDRSLDILLKQMVQGIKVVELTRNYGQHAAVFAGFETADGDIIITMDADLQNPPEEIPRLIDTMEEGNYEVVGTVRRARKDSVFRKIPSRVVNSITRRITGVNLTDWGCMLRAYRRSVVEHMIAAREHSTFIPALASVYAKDIVEIEVGHEERFAGESKYSFANLVSLHFDLITSFSDFPLKFMLYTGFLLAFMGIGFGLVLIVARIYFGAHWAAEGVFTLFAVLFFFMGALFMALGVMGEYVGRIYKEVKKRPSYTIRRVYSSEGLINEDSGFRVS